MLHKIKNKNDTHTQDVSYQNTFYYLNMSQDQLNNVGHIAWLWLLELW